MQQHFVTFYSPGTFVAETTTKPIDTWGTDKAIEMARNVTERYGATPYAFRFSTRSRNDDELDSSVTDKSGFYYLGGKVETLEQVKARATEADRTLASSMESNGYDRIVTTTNGYSWTQPLRDGDVVLDYTPNAD